MTTDAHNFLASLLVGYPDSEHIISKMSDDFSPEFIAGVESFIAGFIAYLAERHPHLHACRNNMERSFGGNVYLSLSGHGAGFWDDSEPEGKELDKALEEYSGGGYRFEQIDLMPDENGKLDLAIVPEAIAGYREKLFKIQPVSPSPPRRVFGPVEGVAGEP